MVSRNNNFIISAGISLTCHLIRQTGTRPRDSIATIDETFHSALMKIAFDDQQDPKEGYPLLELLVRDVSRNYHEPRLFDINPQTQKRRIFFEDQEVRPTL